MVNKLSLKLQGIMQRACEQDRTEQALQRAREIFLEIDSMVMELNENNYDSEDLSEINNNAAHAAVLADKWLKEFPEIGK